MIIERNTEGSPISSTMYDFKCEKCEAVIGGWVSEEKAQAMLRKHVRNKHKAEE